jgi:hypothetical protein
MIQKAIQNKSKEEHIQEGINNAIDQLGQALCNADWHNKGVIEEDRIQYAMRILMKLSNKY